MPLLNQLIDSGPHWALQALSVFTVVRMSYLVPVGLRRFYSHARELANDLRRASPVWEHTFVREYRYTVAQHDLQRPWIIVGQIRHLAVELEDDESFHEWAARAWPRPRYEAQLERQPLRPWGGAAGGN